MEVSGVSREELIAALGQRDAVIEELRAQVAELRRQIGLGPTNSSKPPSSQGYAKPAPRSRRTTSGRRSGGQAGSPGSTLRQVAEPHEVIAYSPSCCARCGAGLGGAPVVSTQARQVADLAPVALVWTEHRIQARRCGCGHITAAGAKDGLPNSVRAPVQYGAGVRAAGTYLVGAHFLPLARCAQVMGDLLGAPVGQGSLATWAADAGAHLEGQGSFTAAVREQLITAPVVHFDESGLRVDGRLRWVHSASTADLSLFTVHDRRGKAGSDAAGVLPVFTGVAVTDCWAPYDCYPRAAHARCNAHLIRELAGVWEAPRAPGQSEQSWAPKLAKRLEALSTMVTNAKAAGASGLDPVELAGQMRWIEGILATGWAQNRPPPRGWPSRKRPVAVNLLTRFTRYQDQFLAFTLDFTVPFTNNQAERDIRPVKIRQKVSGCLRTTAGAQTFAALRSYLSTATKQGHNLLTVLRDLHEGHPWLPTAPAPC